MSEGRTYWWACDAAWYDRERVADLTLEHGPTGAAALHWLCCHAKTLNDGGSVKTGFSAVAKGIGGAVGEVTSAVRYAAEIGALDDFAEDGKRFTCRISGWESDQDRALSAIRQARWRARNAESQSVTPSDSDPYPTEGKEPSGSSSSVADLFAYWQEQCKHPTAKLTADRRTKIAARLGEGYTLEQVRSAIDGAARGAFTNEKGHTFDDLTLICRNGSKLEDFIARASAKASPSKAPLTADHFTPDAEAEAMAAMNARLAGETGRRAGSPRLKEIG